jgi:hypothetical protein
MTTWGWTFKTPGHLAAWSCTFEPYPERPDLWEPGQYVDPDDDPVVPVVDPVERAEFEAVLRSITARADVDDA